MINSGVELSPSPTTSHKEQADERTDQTWIRREDDGGHSDKLTPPPASQPLG